MPVHAHPESHEAIALLSANGRFLIEPAPELSDGPSQGGRLEERRLDGGEQLFIRKERRHGFVPSGQTPTLGIQLYLPPGPEQRFKELSEKR